MRHIRFVLVVYLNLLFFQQAIYSQSVKDVITFNRVDTGLTQSSISTIYEDSEGFLWLGTANGLNKYDGTNFQEYQKSQDGSTGLTNGNIDNIYEDDEHLLYIGTTQGLNIYDRQLDVIIPYPFKNDSLQINSQHFQTIIKDKHSLYLGTNMNGLFKYDIKSGQVNRLAFNEINEARRNNNNVIRIFSLSNENMLMITQASIFIINSDLQIIKKLKDSSSKRIAIQVDYNNFLVGTNTGELIQLKVNSDLSINTEIISTNPGYSILSLAKATNGDIWVGSENDGLSVYSITTKKLINHKTSYVIPNSLPSNSIWSIHRAKNGVMWIGTFKKGLSFYDPEFYKFTHIKNNPFSEKSLSNNIVNCFEADKKGNLWIGTDGGGLNYWNRKENTFDHYTAKDGSLNSNVVLSLLSIGQSSMWIGTWGNGIAIFDKKTKKFATWNTENSFLASNNVMDLMQDSKGRIWIATLFGGLQYYDPATKTHQDIILRSDINGANINSTARLLEDTDGNIWVGTQPAGLFKLSEKKGDANWEITHFHSLSENKKITNNFINTIVQINNNSIWIGTQEGLNKYNPTTNTFEAITMADGLINDAIKGIEDCGDGYLWLSSEDGIIRFNPKSGEKLNYDISDGLQGKEFNASSTQKLAASGEFLFGGSNGFNVFTTAQANKNSDAPKIYLSGLKIFNKDVVPNDDFGVLKQHINKVDTLILSHTHAVVNFEYNAITFRHPEKIKYAYYMDGFETEWNLVGNTTSATYTNLNAGDYTLRIKSTNSDGVWVDNETELQIIVTPPYWETWWFRFLVLALIVLILYLGYRFKVRSIKKNQIKLERQIAERTKELQHQKNMLVEAAEELSSKNEEIQRFTYAVSHDLKSPLNNIKGIASVIPLDFNLEEHPNLKKSLEVITISCNTMSELISDITEISRLGSIENKNELLDTNEILDLSSALISAKLNEQKITLKIAKNLPNIYGDRNRMIQVFSNLMDNAVKYMGDQQKPSITIKASEKGSMVHYSVSDNGSGMDEAALAKLFTPFMRFHAKVKGTGLGLYMSKKIAVSHGGNLRAESEGKGKGATFILSLPKAEIAIQKSKK